MFTKVTENETARQEYLSFKTNCDAFFLDVVTTLCLNDDELPEDDVIKVLIEQVMPKTIANLNADDIDYTLNPTIKSTLLQLLLKFNSNQVETALESIFSKSAEFLKNAYNYQDIIELNIMYINAIEDSLYSTATGVENQSNLIADAKLAIELLRKLSGLIYSDELSAKNEIFKLRTIAEIRFCLVTCSRFVHEFNSDDLIQRTLMDEASDFIKIYSSDWPKYFILKQVFRRYGKSVLTSTNKFKELRWIIPDYLLNDLTNYIPDSYVTCGPEYNRIRSLVHDSFYTGKLEDLSKNKDKHGIYFALAAFKTITLTDFIDKKREDCETLFKLIKESKNKLESVFEMILLKKHLPLELVENKEYNNLAMLIIHIYLTVLAVDSQLINPFKTLLHEPRNFVDQFFPSMPHDEDFETFQIASQDPAKFYKCPNGHYYTIGDCTKPATVSICPTCKSQIGGQSYKLSAGNTEAQALIDTTKRGFCLPQADRRPDQTKAIRKLNPLQTSLIRLMLSSTLYMSSAFGNRDVANLITVEHTAGETQRYFLEQILKELNILSICLQHSVDESALLVHYILNNMQQLPQQVPNIDKNMWKTKEGCKNYEATFSEIVFKNIKGDQIEEIIKEMTFLLKKDSENSNADQLFKIAYEIVTPKMSNEKFKLKNIDEDKCWLYRIHITIEHMTNSFCTSYQNDAKLQLLSKFLTQIKELELIGNLHDISKMVYLLLFTFNRQIDRQQATNMTIKELLKRDDILKSTTNKNLIKKGADTFLKTWNKLHQLIESSHFAQIVDKLNTKQATLNEIDNYEDITLAYLLPSLTKQGRFIYALMVYLINLNNEFLVFYKNFKNDSSINDIELSNLNKNNFINFKCEKDVLKIIYLNCVYSLGYDKNLQTEYKFSKIQVSIEEKLLSKKCIINNKSIPTIEFCDDLTDINQLNKLNDIIHQQSLSETTKEKIISFYKQPNQLTNILRILKVIIDFVVSSKCHDDMKIFEYASDVLKMKISTENNDICKEIFDLELSCVRSLWISLSQHRALLLTQYGQDPFDRLSEKFKQKLEEEDDDSSSEKEILNKILKNKEYFNINNIKFMLSIIYHLIALKLSKQIKVNQSAVNDAADDNEFDLTMSLKDTLIEIALNDNDYVNDRKDEIMDIINDFNLNNLQIQHAFHLWTLIVKAYNFH